MTAEIITIGDELLIGQIVDTNSAWMGEQLSLTGIKVHQISSISDNEEHILQALSEAEKRVDLVLITGGLGPTKDDITKKTLCKYFDTNLVMHEDILEKIKDFFDRRGFKMLEVNKQQAALPENCTIIPNPVGTASGMWFEKNNTVFVSMPGIPHEMKRIMIDGVLPKLKKEFDLPVIIHRTVLTYGVIESELSDLLEDFEKNLPQGMKLAYLPSLERLRLRLSITGTNRTELEKLLDEQVSNLKKYLGNKVFGYEDSSLQEAIGILLKDKGQTVAIAESCTGGNIAHLITSISGSSEYFKGSVIAYDNSIKQTVLKVSEQNLIKHGAVSKEVVEQMALSVQKLMKTDFAIATSGIAGPTGGTGEKPVGTTWIAVAVPSGEVFAKKYVFGTQRSQNIRRASAVALNNLRKRLLEK
ncbi:MAG: competence/damage-inducible protein A [Bacteroidales bacterium]|nr:competence/damage-inducible protein A [Bacteroidales bacterium]